MKNKLLPIWNYLLSGFLGFWSLAFMASSGLVERTVSLWSGNFTARIAMYDLIVFNGGAALAAAAVFQIFMILISIALLALALVQVLKLHGVNIPYLDKVFALKIKIKKDFDLVTLMVFAYILFSLLAMICLSVAGSQASFFVDANNYTKITIGFGPVWLFLSSVIIAAKMVFKTQVLDIMKKVLAKIKNKKEGSQPVETKEIKTDKKLEQNIPNKDKEPTPKEKPAQEKKVKPAQEKKVKPAQEKKVKPAQEKKASSPKQKTPSKETTPKAATPKAATPKAATPKAATPKATNPKDTVANDTSAKDTSSKESVEKKDSPSS